jgi:PASTA domain-containing protein
VRHGHDEVVPSMPPPPPPPPPIATMAPRAAPDPGSAPGGDRHLDRRSLSWRIMLGAVVVVAMLLIAIALSTARNISAGHVVIGAVIVGGGWLAATLALTRSSLGPQNRRRASVALGIMVVLGGVALGARLAHGRTVYQPYYANDPGGCCDDTVTSTTVVSTFVTVPAIPPTTAALAGPTIAPSAATEVVLPNVVGMTVEQATAQLDSVDIGYSIVYTQSSSVPTGVVIEQSIGPGTLIGSRSEITLFVAGGSTMVTSTPVTGATTAPTTVTDPATTVATTVEEHATIAATSTTTR